MKHRFLHSLMVPWLAACAAGATGPPRVDPAQMAQDAVDVSGIKGGLVVQIGCGDGKLTAALRANTSFVIHALETDPARVAEARNNIQALGVYGPVSVIQWDGQQLPYAENMVNLLVMLDAGRVSNDEIMRVLAPLGVACIERDGKWTKTVKPWPKEIDEWTHWLHDAGNNAVAHDTKVGPPQRVQWIVDPLWSRGHEIISSIGGVVTAQGRLIYTLDEGQPGIYLLPSRWVLMARDAFNGVLLWKRALPNWGPPLTSGGHTAGFRPRRLVTDGDRIFLPMGEEDVLVSVDAATGQKLKPLESARGVTDILCGEGVVLAVASAQKNSQPTLFAAKPETMELLWKTPVPGVVAQSVALARGRAFFAAGNAIVALEVKTGKEVWRLPLDKPSAKDAVAKATGPLVVSGSTIYSAAASGLMAISAESGKVAWQNQDAKKAGKKTSELFVADGLVWQFEGSSVVVGHDLTTGKARKTIDASSVFSEGHHPRCYPGKATDRFIITRNRGAEFINLNSPPHTQNDWLRGNCGHGVMPANGLLYAPPNQCFCYGGVMLTGFKALAAGPVPAPPDPMKDETRLERGPAFSAISNLKSEISNVPGDWPMYRHDPGRLGSTTDAVPSEVRPVWKATLGGRLTQPVAAYGMVMVAAMDSHTVHSFNAKDGSKLWSFTAGARIDSSPTIHDGLVLFGCTDGWAYCLRASDGQMAWRFRAAPVDRRVGAFGQFESAWPVHGSVPIVDGIAYFTAGRLTYLDGGIFAYGLDPKSGRIVHYRRLEGEATDARVQSAESPFVPAFHIEGARSDLLVSDGKSIFIGPLKLDTKLARQPTPYVVPGAQKTVGMNLAGAPYVDASVVKADLAKKHGDAEFASLGVLRGPMGDKTMGLHLLSTGGFLDDTYYNRSYWMYGSVWPGFYIAHLSSKAGELLVMDATTTFGVQAYPTRSIHSPTYKPGTKGYLLFADDNGNEPVLDDRTRGRDKGMGYTRAAAPKWFQWMPVRIRAMVKAGDKLFVAGPPDVMEEQDPYAAFEGRRGASLVAVSARDGKKLTELALDKPPVFDGLSAAGGQLFIALEDGSLVCFGKKK